MSKTPNIHLKSVPPGLECAAYLIDIGPDDYTEYQTSDGVWHPSPYCNDVVKQLLQDGFTNFLKAVDESTCKSHLRRLIQNGPPVYLNDPTFNVGEHTHITKVWFMKTNQEIDAKYHGALEGQERMDLWDSIKERMVFLPEEEP